MDGTFGVVYNDTIPLILRLSAELFILLGLISGVMNRQGFQYLAIVASSYICVYRAVLPVCSVRH